MKKYLAVWYDYQQMRYREFEAKSLPEAKHIAFKMMCDSAGDHLYDVEVFEHRYSFQCAHEYNPKPGMCCSEMAVRDYKTGMYIRRHGDGE